jgi:DNA-binding response OmpR family regulator
MKLLFIDDNYDLIESLRDTLGGGTSIDAATTGKMGLAQAKAANYDAIVLDLGLPDIPGQRVCRTIRQGDSTTPILILTGRMDPDAKVSLFTSGADDYVTKPFNTSELRARLRALQRRGHFDLDAAYVLKAADLRLDPLKRIVTRNGERIILRRKEFDILEYLLRNKGKVVSRGMIIHNVWGGQTNSWHNTVDVHVKHLRDRVDRPFDTQLIQTEYGLGYTINGEV